jgi:energy-coupling factor transporter ATP-binding protein EcfA2
MAVELRPNERYALVGKTRSGKTALAMVLAGTWAISLPAPWEVWWIDTKNDPNDLVALRKWGFRNAASVDDQQTTLVPNALYFLVQSQDAEGNDIDVVEQVQAICRAAYSRKYVILVVDEYVQACPSSRDAGTDLLNVFQRGGGRMVGLIGLTQEPVFVPRQLLSQATHICLLSLSYDYDIEYVKKINKEYKNPLELGYPYGFYWKWVDGGTNWKLYENQREWYDSVVLRMPRPTPELTPESEQVLPRSY